MHNLPFAKATRLPGLSASQDFFELLRRIARVLPHGKRLGQPDDYQGLRLRIVQPADMAFAPREVCDVRQSLNDSQQQTEITIHCRHFGLFAPYGPLPIYVTEHARNETLAKRNQAFEHFTSILSQKLAVLHYHAWARMHVAVGHDISSANAFLSHLSQIAGLTPEQPLNEHITRIRRHFPGVYLPGRKSLCKLQAILGHYFSVAIRIQTRQGSWIDDDSNLTHQRMGHLGSTRIGRRFYDIQHSLKISIGPVGSPQYLNYQRNSERIRALVSICRDFVHHHMVLDVQLIIQTSPDMACRPGNGRLGRDSWLKPGSALRIQPVYKTVT